MSDIERLGNYQAIVKVFGRITKAEWAALSPKQRDQLGAEARTWLREQKEKAA